MMTSKSSHPTGSSHSVASSSTSKAYPLIDPRNNGDESTQRIHQDISILTHKLADLSGDLKSNTSSPFVSGIRTVTETERKNIIKGDSNKLNLLEKLLEKMAEFDRLVLRKTAPESVGPQRRGSRGSDLSTLPTHLHLTDRLLDLYAQSQRVTVIRTTIGNGHDTNNPTTTNSVATNVKPAGLVTAPDENRSNTADKKLIETLKENVTKLSKQLEVLEEKKVHSEEEINRMKRETINSQVKLEVLNKKLESSIAALAESQKSTIEMSNKKKDLDHMLSESHQRLEIETGTYQNILKVILGKASRINENRELTINDCLTLPLDMQNAMNLLENAISKRQNGLLSELTLLGSVKEMLEGELGSANLQREMLSKDLNTLSEEHEALKAAYHALETESVTRRSSSDGNLSRELQQLRQQLEAANDKTLELQVELQAATKRNIDLAKSANMNNASTAAAVELENKLRLVIAEKARLESGVKSALDELDSYKKLTEKLKAKIREMGAGSKESRDFLDTFEEVMRDEMAAMKAAFELKLRLAREEADATSRRHQQEIARMQTASPYR